LSAKRTPSELGKISYCTPSDTSDEGESLPEEHLDEDMSLRRPESILHELFPGNAALASYLAVALNASSEEDVTLLDRIRSAAFPTRQHGGEQGSSPFSASTVGATSSSNTPQATNKTSFTSLGNDGDGGFGNAGQNDPTRPGPSEAGHEPRDPAEFLRCHFPNCTRAYKDYNNLL
jgi:hypothetical protein